MPLWKKAGLALLFLLVAIVGVPVAYVVHHGGIAELLESRINAASGEARVKVSDARLMFRSAIVPIYIRAGDIGITLDDTELHLPQTEIFFGLKSLISGVPSEVSIKGLELDVVRNPEGWSGSPLVLYLLGAAGAANHAPAEEGATASLPEFGRLTILANRLSISHHNNEDVAPLRFDNAIISLTTDKEVGFGGFLRASRPDDDGGGSVTADFAGMPGVGEFLVDLIVDDMAVEGIAPYFDAVPQIVDGMGRMSGAVSAALDGPMLSRLDVAASARGGVIAMPGAGREAGFDEIWFDASYRQSANLLSIGDARVSLADGRVFTFSGDIGELHTPKPAVRGSLGVNRISLAELDKDWPATAAPAVKALVFERLSGGAVENIKFSFAGTFDRASSQLQMAGMDMSAVMNGIRMDVGAGQYRRIVSTMDGRVEMRLGAGGVVERMGVTLDLHDGSVLLDDYAGAEGIDKITLAAEISDSTLKLEDFDVAFGNGTGIKINGSMPLAADWTPQALSLSLASRQIDAKLFHALWPQWAAPKARDWIKARVPRATVKDAVLEIDATFKDGGPEVGAMSGSFAIADADITVATDVPQLTNVSGKIGLDNDSATIILDQGSLGDLALQYGRVTIAPLFANFPTEAIARISLKGGLATAVDVAAGLGVGKIGVFDLKTIEPAGEIEMTMNATLPIDADLSGDQVSIAADATISGGSFANLPYGLRVDNAELVANFANNLVELTGTAEVAEIASDFSFQSDVTENKVSFIAKAAPSTIIADKLANLTDFEIGGRVGGSVTMQTDMSFDALTIQLSTDMRGASVNVPELSWAKLPAENGYGRMTFVLRNGRVERLQDVDISLGSLSIIGQVALGQTGALQGAFLERITWPGNDLREVIVEANGDELKIGAEARIVDLAPLRRNKGVSAGRKISFDLVADQFVVGDGVTLGGHLTGTKFKQGGGSAVFSGNLLYQGRPLVNEAELKLVFGDSGEFLKGNGLVGGAETSIHFVDGKNRVPQLTMASKNAGRLLNGLDVTDAIRSGEIEIINRFVPGNFSDFDSEMRLSNFNVVEAPRAVRAFSVLGPIGLLQLVKGDGTRFDWGEAAFHKRGSSVSIKTMRGGGSDIAVSMVGRYDKNTREVDISGNLVPASLINTVIGAIPILGNLLTGIDKDGLFVTQFSMTGPVDDPDTSAKAASLVPGILRDVISPDWIGRETERLFGNGQDGEDNAKTTDGAESSAQ